MKLVSATDDPVICYDVEVFYGFSGPASKAKRDMKALLLRNGFFKEKTYTKYHKHMSDGEWTAFFAELKPCVERLSRYANFSVLKIWINGRLVFDQNGQKDGDVQQAA